MAFSSRLERRSTVAVLVFIVTAVAMLGLLVAETVREGKGVAAFHVDQLVQLEAVCVALLLAALGLIVRIAIAPTEQRLASTVSALAESESRIRAMLDTMSEGMLLSDASGTLLTWNPSAQRLLALGGVGGQPSLASLLPRLVDGTGAPIQLEQLPSRIALRTGEPLSNAKLGVRTDGGAVRWLSVNAHPLYRGNASEPHAAVAIFRDVTDERQQEEEQQALGEALEQQNRELILQTDALERERAIFRSLVETAGNAIVGLDVNGRIFEWNREAEAMFGVARAKALGQDYVGAFVPPTHRETIREGLAVVLAGRTLRNITAPVHSADGARRTVIWNLAPLVSAPGAAPHGLIVAGLDITEREASDERFRLLFERSSDAHLLIDDAGVLDCNDATLRLLGYDSKTPVLGRSVAELSPRRQPDGRLSVVVGGQMRQIARDRGFHRFEWVHQRADGSLFPVEVTLTPVRLNGREAILSVWHDIAERKAVEDALRSAKEAAEVASRMKSEFVTRMNHELRTPLTAIIGFSRVLLQGKQGELGEGAERYIDRIRANGMHLLTLINQILDVAKVEAGRMELEPERVQLDVVVRETIAMLESTADAKGIVLRAVMPASVAPMVTDGAKLRQILINLVGNSIKFTESGEVVVAVEVHPFTKRPVSVSVRDTGVGIPVEWQSKVFEPFAQGDSSTRREFGGTGLGLSIVQSFAALIRAEVRLESTVGQGTTFTVLLPSTDLELPSGV